jgi:acid phosphatase family membrane protein YuiD
MIIAPFIGFILAQAIKVIRYAFKEKKINFKWFVEMGGMPSSHMATATALSTIAGLEEGFSSAFFALALAFNLFVMYDAAGVRRAAGEQAEILNTIIDDVYKDKGIKEARVRELLGHTPIEVIVGALLGIGVAIWVH